MRSRLPIVIVLVAALLVAGGTRYWATGLRGGRTAAGERAAATEATTLGQVDSFTLGLLLGGLRGPLVMALWTSSENQKSERDLADFDTKIELIRLLQPEFDTVHLFQIWNKAYNISVQMANLPNKYAVILDALDYAAKVDAERPDNINIQAAVAGIFFNKLGESSEKLYYRQRMRDETLPPRPATRVTFPADRRQEFVDDARRAGADPAGLLIRTATPDRATPDRATPDRATPDRATPDRAAARAEQPDAPAGDRLSVTLDESIAERMKVAFSGPGVEYADRPRRELVRDDTGRRLKYDTLLDQDDNLLPQYLDPAGHADGVGELGYLKPFEPFPTGVSTFALAYNYYRRSQYLQNELGQSHAQLSDRVMDSRPALSLMMWAKEDKDRGRRFELAAFGESAEVDDDYLRDAPTAAVPVTADLGPEGASRPLLERAIYEYGRSVQVADAAVTAFEQHVAAHPDDAALYQSQIDDMRGLSALGTGDRAYLRAVLATDDPAARRAAAAEAEAAYQQAIHQYQTITLRYFAPAELLDPSRMGGLYQPGMDRFNLIDRITAQRPDLINPLYGSLVDALQSPTNEAYRSDEIIEYGAYINRAASRLQQIDESGALASR